MPPFIVDVFDWDMGPLEDDYIARSIIPVTEAAISKDDTIPKPKWHPCHLKPGTPACGEILISFSIVEDDYNYKVPLNYLDLKETVDF